MGLEAFFDKAGVYWDSLSEGVKGTYFLLTVGAVAMGLNYLDNLSARESERIIHDLPSESLTAGRSVVMRREYKDGR